MRADNLTKLAGLLNTSIGFALKDQSRGCEIWMDHYASLYFDIFFDEARSNGTPTPYDAFSEQLVSMLMEDINHDKVKHIMQDFILYWMAWTDLYREMMQRGMVNHDAH